MSRRPRVLITRTRHQASALAARLEALGAETVLIPTIELAPPSSYEVLDAALEALTNPSHNLAWLLFTSANAVNTFSGRCREKGLRLHPRRIAVIGPATLKALEDSTITPQTGPVLMSGTYVAESLAAALLAESGPAPQRFLLVRAEEARDVIPAALEAAGHHVTIAPAYRNIIPPESIRALQTLFAAPENQPDIIAFTSSSTARNLFTLLEAAGIGLPAGVALASIGPITSATLCALGHGSTIESAEPTIDSLTAAIATLLLR